MAQRASRSRSPRTETVATFSSQRARGTGGGLRARTALGSLRRVRTVLSAILDAPRGLQKLAQTARQVLLRLRGAGGLLHFGPLRRRPDLDALDGARPGDFLAQSGVLAQSGRDEDA